MNLNLNVNLSAGYSSKSQIARILTEDWVVHNSYCPSCGNSRLEEFENNRPVADFYCSSCKEEYELKSKNGKLPSTIADGAYDSMIERINSANNPNFFFLTYTASWTVSNFIIIPKQFFNEEIIIKRKPLKETARRAGWIGCNINISKIPAIGKVFLVKNNREIDRGLVQNRFNKTLFLRTRNLESKGWILDVLKCIDRIPTVGFTLNDVYKFEKELAAKHPDNNFIKDKIRQQLQLLRDKGFIEFRGRGRYTKVVNEEI